MVQLLQGPPQQVLNFRQSKNLNITPLCRSVTYNYQAGQGGSEGQSHGDNNRCREESFQESPLLPKVDFYRKVVTPEALQPGIDAIVAKFNQGRSFVRPRY